MCKCINIETGSYGNQVELIVPSNIKIYENNIEHNLKTTVCVDRCLEEEIKHLWSLDITTTGCCCGHNRLEAYIGVIDSDINRMKELGYKVRFNKCRPNDEDSFIPKSI